MFWYRFGEQTDSNSYDGSEEEQEYSEVEIMEVCNDGESVILSSFCLLLVTGRSWNGVLHDEPGQTYYQAQKEGPKRSLKKNYMSNWLNLLQG